MLYSVLIAICAASTPVTACSSETALSWMIAPEPGMLVACGLHGQQYAAQSRLVTEGTYVRIFCRPLVQDATRESSPLVEAGPNAAGAAPEIPRD
jgi:hypothetical protein